MKVYYDQSPAGAGKTGRQIDEITKEPCKVLFVTERIESFHELEMRINAQAARNVSIPIIDTVHSDGSERLGSVSRQIEALPDRHRRHDHVVVLATQALYLKHYFDSLPYVSGTIELVTDAPVIPATGKLGRKKVVRSPEEKAEYDREKRARDAARKRKARAEARAFRKAA